MAQSAPPPASSNAGKTPFRVEFQDKAKPANIRQTNIIAAKGFDIFSNLPYLILY